MARLIFLSQVKTEQKIVVGYMPAQSNQWISCVRRQNCTGIIQKLISRRPRSCFPINVFNDFLLFPVILLMNPFRTSKKQGNKLDIQVQKYQNGKHFLPQISSAFSFGSFSKWL